MGLLADTCEYGVCVCVCWVSRKECYQANQKMWIPRSLPVAGLSQNGPWVCPFCSRGTQPAGLATLSWVLSVLALSRKRSWDSGSLHGLPAGSWDAPQDWLIGPSAPTWGAITLALQCLLLATPSQPGCPGGQEEERCASPDLSHQQPGWGISQDTMVGLGLGLLWLRPVGGAPPDSLISQGGNVISREPAQDDCGWWWRVCQGL